MESNGLSFSVMEIDKKENLMSQFYLLCSANVSFKYFRQFLGKLFMNVLSSFFFVNCITVRGEVELVLRCCDIQQHLALKSIRLVPGRLVGLASS